MFDEIYKKINLSPKEIQSLLTDIVSKQHFPMDDKITEKKIVSIFKIMFILNEHGELEARCSTLNKV